MAELPLLPLAIDLGDIIRLIFLFLFLGVGAIRLFTDAANAQKQKGQQPPPDPGEAKGKRKRNPQDSIREEVEEFLRRSGQRVEEQPAAQRERPPRIEVIMEDEDGFAVLPTPRDAEDKTRVPPVVAPPKQQKERRKAKTREERDTRSRYRREEFATRASEMGEVLSQTDERLEARLAQKFDGRLGNLADMRRIREAADQVRENREEAPAIAKELLATLTSPMGMRQAIILHEILDRPINRW